MPRQARSSRSSSWRESRAVRWWWPCARTFERATTLAAATASATSCCLCNHLILLHTQRLRKFRRPSRGGESTPWHSRVCTTSPRSPRTPRATSTSTRACSGLRLVKKTVNFDQPDVYHLYFGDERGTPGSILTFFEFPGAAPGPGRRRHGPHHPVARRLRRGARLLGRAPGRRGRRHRAHRGRRAGVRRLRGPAPRAARRRRRRRAAGRRAPTTSRPSTRCWASTACAPTPRAPSASTRAARGDRLRPRRRRRLDAARRRAPRGAALRRPAGRAAASRAPARSTTSRGRPPTTPSSRPSARGPSQRRRARDARSSTASTSTPSTSASPAASSSSSPAATSASTYDEPLESLGEALQAAAAVRGAPRSSSSAR